MRALGVFLNLLSCLTTGTVWARDDISVLYLGVHDEDLRKPSHPEYQRSASNHPGGQVQDSRKPEGRTASSDPLSKQLKKVKKIADEALCNYIQLHQPTGDWHPPKRWLCSQVKDDKERTCWEAPNSDCLFDLSAKQDKAQLIGGNVTLEMEENKPSFKFGLWFFDRRIFKINNESPLIIPGTKLCGACGPKLDKENLEALVTKELKGLFDEADRKLRSPPVEQPAVVEGTQHSSALAAVPSAVSRPPAPLTQLLMTREHARGWNVAAGIFGVLGGATLVASIVMTALDGHDYRGGGCSYRGIDHPQCVYHFSPLYSIGYATSAILAAELIFTIAYPRRKGAK